MNNNVNPRLRAIVEVRTAKAPLAVVLLVAACTASMVALVANAQPAAAPTEDINSQFLDPKMDPEEWQERFEGESREVFVARQAILAAVGVKAGDEVADIGAGTGLFTASFAGEVGDDGWVYAVDISSRFLEFIAQRAAAAGLANITPVLCTERSTNLPPGSIDVAYVCDTYHHFEHPADTLASIHAALRPGGRLVIVDFEREEGVSSDWVLAHVRAGKAVVTAEIEAAGFALTSEPEVQGLEENYLLVFVRE
jgi:predicted methyltransferase